MTNETILKKAIEKAVKNGYKTTADIDYIIKKIFGSPYPEVFYRGMIIDHDFAKAFWGKKLVVNNVYPIYLEIDDKEAELPAWQYHLQQIVLEKEPLKYLAQFLNESKSSKN